ncbi:hypothetical protein [Actinophytocola algeriensis]|uniref:Uncharacterized protein n=1 Tax=Actinophytocola algeriensis TaxID=1768010 RepID=A0A7W7Q0A2_9PSEU|nr:hypothetical protein [Actinophytocola algeriensis]MBB4904436.1 hypothetical protein [Actinophytocola algeriensis]MBE1476705.1 hypothetical protein [Actinophytocola algeriensis]
MIVIFTGFFGGAGFALDVDLLASSFGAVSASPLVHEVIINTARPNTPPTSRPRRGPPQAITQPPHLPVIVRHSVPDASNALEQAIHPDEESDFWGLRGT